MGLNSTTFKNMLNTAQQGRTSIEKIWNANFDMWVGKHWTEKELEKVRAPIVIPFTQGKILFLLSAVSDSPPHWTVIPVGPEDIGGAKL